MIPLSCSKEYKPAGKLFLLFMGIMLILAYSSSAFTPKYRTQINLEPIKETSFLRLARNVSEWNYEVLRIRVIESNLTSNNLSAVLVTEIKLRDENKTRVIEHRMNLTIQGGYFNFPYNFGEIAIFDGDVEVYKGRIILIQERMEISPSGYFLMAVFYACLLFFSLVQEHSLTVILCTAFIFGIILVRYLWRNKIF